MPFCFTILTYSEFNQLTVSIPVLEQTWGCMFCLTSHDREIHFSISPRQKNQSAPTRICAVRARKREEQRQSVVFVVAMCVCIASGAISAADNWKLVTLPGWRHPKKIVPRSSGRVVIAAVAGQSLGRTWRRMKGRLNGPTTSCECILLSLCAYSYNTDCHPMSVCVLCAFINERVLAAAKHYENAFCFDLPLTKHAAASAQMEMGLAVQRHILHFRAQIFAFHFFSMWYICSLLHSGQNQSIEHVCMFLASVQFLTELWIDFFNQV